MKKSGISRTYQFSEEIRKAYEAQPLALVYDQYIDGKVVPLLMSEGFLELVGMDREHAMKWFEKGQFERIHPDDAGRVMKVSEDFIHHCGVYDVVFRSRHEDGYHFIHAMGKWQIMEDGTELALLSYADVSRSTEYISTLEERYRLFRKDLFYTDPLTELPNLNYYRQFAEEKIHAIRVGRREPMVVYFDICSMKSYNNQYGIAKGDELLHLLARILKETFPKALVVRGADDHFILTDGFEGMSVLNGKILAADRRFRKEAHGNTTGIQAGISFIKADETATDALDHARTAIRSISQNMNETFSYYSGSQSEVFRKERYIIEHFEQAMSEGWIQVYYQAIIRVKTGKVSSLEGLARWIDPEQGMLSPGEFIPVLEKYHMLNRLDLYIAEQVCKEIPKRVEAGFPLVPVSVNFSAQDFDYADIPSELDRIYRTCFPQDQSKTRFLIVEITEQDMVKAEAFFASQLEALRNLGFRIWLDDFGSAYSSLNAFSRFDVNLIKFDMDLLRHIDDPSGVNRKILRAMTAIAAELGIDTLAEGMETEEQKNFLKEIGCDLAQGYLFHKPESLEGIVERIGSGENARECETPEERAALEKSKG